jgi:hypothetical protein
MVDAAGDKCIVKLNSKILHINTKGKKVEATFENGVSSTFYYVS